METKVGTVGGTLGGVTYGFLNFIIGDHLWAGFLMAMFTAFCAAIFGYLGTLFIKWLIKVMKRK